MEGWMVQVLAPDELDWELTARGFDCANWTVDKCREFLITLLQEGRLPEPIEGNLGEVCDQAIKLCKEISDDIKNNALTRGSYNNYLAKLKHIENKVTFTSDARDPKRISANRVLKELLAAKNALKQNFTHEKSPNLFAAQSNGAQIPPNESDATFSMATNSTVEVHDKGTSKPTYTSASTAANVEPIFCFSNNNLNVNPHLEVQGNHSPSNQMNYADALKRYDGIIQDLANMMNLLSTKLDNFQQRSAQNSFVEHPIASSRANSVGPRRDLSFEPPMLRQDPMLPRQSTPNSSVGGRRLKPLHVKDWNLSFSGDRRGKKARIFLKEVQRMAMIQGISLEEVQWSMRFMLSGGALTWYDSYSHVLLNCTWEQFSVRFLNAFYDSESDFSVRKRIEERKQGQNENVEVFVAAMLSLFEELEGDLSEVEKVRLIRRNLHSSLRNALLLVEIHSVEELCEKLKLVERNRSYAYTERREVNAISASARGGNGGAIPKRSSNNRRNSAASNSTNASSSRDSANVSDSSDTNVQGSSRGDEGENTSGVCIFCKKSGHKIRACMFRPRVCCFKCCKPGVITRTCPNCSASGNEQSTH
ncbi:uncharacterized protein LOC129795926 [Lutzomyia longipalpis]|uniref:uncharacterized protein LOC129795926 n=1 Tax=Lutzomyia longipalpis TaxID=7200 RepID=UPI0024839D6E|nr:uncharacterized protein LOC129795926 [Lutzomyia longipalpis]XP_055693453.1 uncharacterized protein LOC129795926 [Lutzomyia longipalpis]